MPYNSLYVGVVADTKDPKRLGRIKARLGILGDAFTTHWLLPINPGAGPQCGQFCVPPVGAGVVVLFAEGDLEAGWYVGGYWAEPTKQSEVPRAFQRIPPSNQGMRSPKGQLLELDDLPLSAGIRLTTAGKLQLQLDDAGQCIVLSTPSKQSVCLDAAKGSITVQTAQGSKLQLAADGSVQLQHATGQKVTLKEGNISIQSTATVKLQAASVHIDAGKVSVGQGATLHPVVAEKLATFFNTHTHGTAMGPSTPPTVPMVAPAVAATTVTVGG